MFWFLNYLVFLVFVHFLNFILFRFFFLESYGFNPPSPTPLIFFFYMTNNVPLFEICVRCHQVGKIIRWQTVCHINSLERLAKHIYCVSKSIIHLDSSVGSSDSPTRWMENSDNFVRSLDSSVKWRENSDNLMGSRDSLVRCLED